MRLFQRNSWNTIYTVKQTIDRARKQVIFFSIAFAAVVVSLSLTFFFVFTSKTNQYYSDISNTRIRNTAKSVEKNIDLIMESCFANLEAFEYVFNQAEGITENGSLNTTIFNQTCDNFYLSHSLEDTGVIYNHTMYIGSREIKESIISSYTREDGKIIFFSDTYLYFTIPSNNTDTNVQGFSTRILLEKFEEIIQTDVYNGNATILISDNEKNYVISSINHKNEYSRLTSQDLSQHTDKEIELISEKLNTSGPQVFESSRHGVKYVTYKNEVKNSPSSITYKFILLVPRDSLISQLQSSNQFYRYIILITYFSFVVLMLLSIQKISKLTINNKINQSYDHKTGLLNEVNFLHDAKAILLTHTSDYALISLNIRGFTKLNSTYGITAADSMLIEIADILNELLTDEGELAGYTHADNFILLLRGTKDEILFKIGILDQALTAKPYKDGIEPYFKYGIKMTNTTKALDVQSEFDYAKFAQKSITEVHKENYYFFDDSILRKFTEDNELIERFEDALKNEEFEVYLQLKWDLNRNNWGGAEALVRWRTPTKGLISPGKFIPLFEMNGYITQLDEYMFEHVCQIISKQLDNGEECVPISLNLSRRNFNDLSFIARYKELVEKYKIPHQLIEFEITEGLLMDNVNNYIKFIDEMHEDGYYISMDDFGAGYSSLNMINELNFDVIKLDAKFFRSNFDYKNKIVVSQTIELCHQLGKHVVAEGIEDANEVQFLRTVNCDLIQGYYFSKPMPYEEFRKMLK